MTHQYQVRWDEWTGAVWMQRVSEPMSELAAEDLCRELYQGLIRNVALCTGMPVQ